MVRDLLYFIVFCGVLAEDKCIHVLQSYVAGTDVVIRLPSNSAKIQNKNNVIKTMKNVCIS